MIDTMERPLKATSWFRPLSDSLFIEENPSSNGYFITTYFSHFFIFYSLFFQCNCHNYYQVIILPTTVTLGYPLISPGSEILRAAAAGEVSTVGSCSRKYPCRILRALDLVLVLHEVSFCTLTSRAGNEGEQQ